METKVIACLVVSLALMYGLPADAGVYIRWGRTTCVAGSLALYTGNIASQYNGNVGGSANYICLSDSPSWGNVNPVAKQTYAPVAGVLYFLPDYTNNNPFSYANYNNQDIHLKSAPCVACISPNTNAVMIPGQTSCPSDTTVEYSGYLVANHDTNYKSEYICLDGAPEVSKTGGSNQSGGVLVLAQIWCGLLACPYPYAQYKQVSCSVCSI